MMAVFTERRFGTGYNFAMDELFFFQQDLILRMTKVLFPGNLVWWIIKFIWWVSGITTKSLPQKR